MSRVTNLVLFDIVYWTCCILWLWIALFSNPLYSTWLSLSIMLLLVLLLPLLLFWKHQQCAIEIRAFPFLWKSRNRQIFLKMSQKWKLSRSYIINKKCYKSPSALCVGNSFHIKTYQDSLKTRSPYNYPECTHQHFHKISDT